MKGNKFSQNRLNRCAILTLSVVLALLLSGCGAERPRVYRVGIVSGSDAFVAVAEGFKAGMAELGYVEGENIVYETQPLPTNVSAEWQRAAEQYVADKVDLIFVFPTGPALIAKAAAQGTNIPVVFAMGALEGNDLVENVRQPGGNITGVRIPGIDSVAKRLEILHELAPQAERIYLPFDPSGPTIAPSLEALRAAAGPLGVTLVEAPASSAAEVEADLQARAASDDTGIDAILMLPEPLVNNPDVLQALLTFGQEHRVPVGGCLGYTAQLGALFAYASDIAELGALAAPLADKILKGAEAGTLPVVTPEERLTLNYRVAQDLGLTVPEDLLSMATEIIR